MKRRLKPKIKQKLILLGILFIIVGITFFTYQITFKPVSNKDEKVDIIVKKGTTFLSLADQLKENRIIRSKMAYKIYIKTHEINKLHEGKYTLNRNMTIKEIVNELNKASKINPNSVVITFKEGINMRKIIDLITTNTNHTEEEIKNLLKDQNYLNELIHNYWFLTEEIKNPNIYYALEGYLFPDTYEFTDKNVEIKEIFKTMLDHMNKKLEPYQDILKNQPYTVHQILTLASIVELEASFSDDRNGVAGVFYNRLNRKWSLGSDVTTYYALQIDLNERDLYQSELEEYNPYNTRSPKMAGKLPVGPICIPSIESIEAAIKPSKHEYLYFVADKYKKTYFASTASEHDRNIAKLKKENLWYQY